MVYFLGVFGDREGLVQPLELNSPTCHGTYVSAFYDIGPLRDSRAAYVASTAKLARLLKRMGCSFLFYCGDECTDFKAHVPDARYLPMTTVLHTVYGAEHAYEQVRATITRMRRAPGHLGGGDMDAWDVDNMARYTMVNNAKFVAVESALDEVGYGPLVWIDAGLFRNKGNSKGFYYCDALCPVLTDTAAFSISSLSASWAPRLNTIYVAGGRKEIAAGVMVFNRRWYKTFLKTYINLLRSMLREGYVTTEQALLTLMAQKTKFTLMEPSYYRIATRMLCSDARNNRCKTKNDKPLTMQGRSELLIDSECMAVPPEASKAPVRNANVPLDICIGVLANEGWRTISNSFRTWHESGLLVAVKERILFIQGPPRQSWNAKLESVARKYGFRTIVSQDNVVFDAIFQLNDACSATNFLFLEEDWAIAPGVRRADVTEQISNAVNLLGTGLVHGVRLRHVRWGGSPNWALDTWTKGSYDGDGGGSRAKWGAGVPYSKYPCPDCSILRDLGDSPPRPVKVNEGDYFAPRGPNCQAWKCVSSPITYCMRTSAHDKWYRSGKDKYVFYTNNPMVWRSTWIASWRKNGREQDYRGFEPTIQASKRWNSQPGFIIARGKGLFQHKRLDRGKN